MKHNSIWYYKITTLAGICIGSLLFMSTASAAEPGFYLGAGIGFANIVTDDDEDDLQDALNASGLTGTIDNDTKNFGWKVYGGYTFSEYFGFELAYLRLGQAEVTADVTAPVAGSIRAKSEIRGVEYVITGYFPVSDKWDLTARIGAVSWDADPELIVAGSGSVIPVTAFGDADGTNFTIGIGFNRNINDRWTWHSGLQYFADVRKDLFLMNSGLSYHF